MELDTNDDPEMSKTEIRAVGDQHHESLRLQEIRKHAAQDKEYQLLQNFILKGFPKHHRQLSELGLSLLCLKFTYYSLLNFQKFYPLFLIYSQIIAYYSYEVSKNNAYETIQKLSC